MPKINNQFIFRNVALVVSVVVPLTYIVQAFLPKMVWPVYFKSWELCLTFACSFDPMEVIGGNIPEAVPSETPK